MKITLKRTDEQVELIKAMASKNREVAYEAQAALAEFIGPVIAEVINKAPVLSNLFAAFQFEADSNPSLPLDLYYDISAEDYIQVHSTTIPGGLPTNHVLPTASELKFTTYRLDSAVSFDRRYAAQSRLDVVGKTMTRVAQEVLLKQQQTSANLLLTALAQASTGGEQHVATSKIAGAFLLADLNAMITRAKRVNAAWNAGTPVGGSGNGLTDLIVSPEVMEMIRAMAYNPVNTKTAGGIAPGTSTTQGGDAWIAAPESVRSRMWDSAGTVDFFGVNLTEANELGPERKYTKIYNAAATAAGGTAVPVGANGDLVIGLDLSRDSLIRAVAVDAESGSEFTLVADDQYSIRQQKIGFFGSLEEGRMVIDNRTLLGTVVNA
tara:strand:- start:579 stop:1715 length:1137 start_codon:yes stop_codon:yes gene_type:complete